MTQRSDDGGNVTFTFTRDTGFPADKSRQLGVVFVRAIASGGPTLSGTSARRLVSLR